ncbi:MAG TPA: hypothetical protein VHG08_20865 [Longimicrobium sp.]|nr:hypothetical protein [Longimicrobium sp.]
MTRRRTGRIILALVLALAVLLAAGTCALPRPGPPRAAPPPAGAREATVVVSERYRAGAIRRFLLGGGYREVWATPVRVEVLDVAGLAPMRRGGSGQTHGLHLRDAQGRHWVFRATDKDQARRLGGLERALLGRFRQDQVGAMHPAAAVVAGALQESAGVLNAPPRLVVMPDAPQLDSFRVAFAGLPGTFEERPRAGFAGASRVLDTEELLRQEAPVIDTAAYLRMRLVDVFLGDWDRHDGQVRWAWMERGGAGRWVPVPRDRDYAFADYRGVLPALARGVDAKIVRFDGEYRDLAGLLAKARALDVRFLCGVPPAAWDSTAAGLRRSLSDAAITAAVGRMPREYAARSAPRLTATLRARRDRLPDAARRFRTHLHAGGACTGS